MVIYFPTSPLPLSLHNVEKQEPGKLRIFTFSIKCFCYQTRCVYVTIWSFNNAAHQRTVRATQFSCCSETLSTSFLQSYGPSSPELNLDDHITSKLSRRVASNGVNWAPSEEQHQSIATWSQFTATVDYSTQYRIYDRIYLHVFTR